MQITFQQIRFGGRSWVEFLYARNFFQNRYVDMLHAIESAIVTAIHVINLKEIELLVRSMKNIKALLKYHVCLVSGFNIYLVSNELHESATIVMPDRPLQNYTVGILFDRPNNNNKNILNSNQRNIKAILSRSYLWHIDVIAFRKKHIIPAIFQIFVKKELQQKHKPKGGSSWKDMKIHNFRLSLNYERLGCHFRHSKQTSSNIQNLQLQTDVKMLQALFLRTIVFKGNSPSSNNQNYDFQK